MNLKQLVSRRSFVQGLLSGACMLLLPTYPRAQEHTKYVGNGWYYFSVKKDRHVYSAYAKNPDGSPPTLENLKLVWDLQRMESQC